MSRIAQAVRLDGEARARGWQHALPALALALLALAVPMAQPVLRLIDLWLNNGSYGHGVLIVPVMLYLLFLQRQQFLSLTPAPSLGGLAPLAAAILLWFAGRMLGIVMVEQLALVASLLAVPWAVLGFHVAWRAAPIIVYLMCAVPVWTYLTPMLQDHTAAASTVILRALGVPVYLEGLYISIPDGRFVVADVCSGMRYLLAALSLGGFYALLNLHAWWSRVILVAASFVLGIVFNWIRVAGIVYAGHQSQMRSSLVTDHITFGWALFLAVVVAILVLGALLEGAERRRVPILSEARAMPQSVRGSTAFLVSAALVAAVSIPPAALAAVWLRPPAQSIALDLAQVPRAGGWKAADAVSGQWRPKFSGMDASAFATFEQADAAASVDLFVAYYAFERQDSEAVNMRNKTFDANQWRRYDLRPVPDRVQIVPGMAGEEYLLQSRDGANRRLVWRTNWVNGRFVLSQLEAKMQQVLGLFSSRRVAASLVFSTSIVGDEDQARARLRDFAAANLPPLVDHLRTLSADPASDTR
jgi:exosortase A